MSSSAASAPCTPNNDDAKIISTYLQLQAAVCFKILYDRYAGKIFSKALTMLGDEEIAEDATQEIFTKIFLNLGKFNGKSKFSTWVYSVTYNFCIDYIRKNKKSKNLFAKEIDNPPDLEASSDVSDAELLTMEVSRLKRVLENLPDADRSILLMKYQDDMSIRDISSIINKNESAVKMRLKRAKEKAKKLHDKLFPQPIDH